MARAASDVREFVLAHVSAHPEDLARLVALRFGITRQAANRHLRRLVEQGLLVADGRTRSREYRLKVLGRVEATLAVTPALQEDQVWHQQVLPLLADVPENVRDVCSYGFTEMVNNAKDHSGSPTVSISAEVTAASVEMIVSDEGVGIFRKIKEALGLEDERHAILELVKGKFTTDPDRHTGEGIFFSSRMFDAFSVGSGGLALVPLRDAQDFLVREQDARPGTLAAMQIATWSTHTMDEVFSRYATEQDDYAFRRTHVVVALVESEGDKLVSRSQAKRLMARLEKFREVVLDFKRVDSIGPAFADEVFRVFATEHPHVHLSPVNVSDEVKKMIRRAENSGPP